MSFLNQQTSTVTTPAPISPSDIEINEVLPNGGLMTPHDQRRRAALLADSPELSSRPPLNAGGGSGSILGVLQQAHTQMSSASGGSSSSTTSSIHPNYGFDHVEICLDDAIEVQSPDINRRSNPCCLFCKSKKCTNFKWKLKATFGGLTESRVWKSILLGQLISLLLCTITVLCQILVENYSVKIPTGQSLITYIMMTVTYLSLFCCSNHGGNSTSEPKPTLWTVFKRRGIRYFFLSVVDVEANYLIHRAFHYTTLTSVQLLDCFSIPTVLILSWVVLRARYRLTHIGGMALGLMSVVVLVWADIEDGKGGVSSGGKSRLVGDMLALGGAFLTGICHVGLEHSVQYYDMHEFLGLVGLFGTIITTVQMSLLERVELVNIRWELWEISVLLLAFAIAQFAFYSCLPYLLKMTSATALNLNLLATDYYTIVAGIVFFNYKFNPWHFLSISVIWIGLIVFHIFPVPIGSAKNDMISKDESAHSTFTELITRKNRSPSPHFKCNGGTHIPLSALKDISNYSPTEVQVHAKLNGRPGMTI